MIDAWSRICGGSNLGPTACYRRGAGLGYNERFGTVVLWEVIIAAIVLMQQVYGPLLRLMEAVPAHEEQDDEDQSNQPYDTSNDTT